jgi:hypothetical protein
MEPVVPADSNVMDIATSCNSDLPLDNIVVSAITPYQLVRHLTALITLANDLKMTAMVDSGAMGNFIHLRFVKEHQLVMKEQTPLTVNNVNSCLLLCMDQQVVWMDTTLRLSPSMSHCWEDTTSFLDSCGFSSMTHSCNGPVERLPSHLTTVRSTAWTNPPAQS